VSNQSPYIVVKSEFLYEINTRCCAWLLRRVIPQKRDAMVRAKIEQPFRVVERQFGHAKTRYRGLARNRLHLFTLFALGNLFLV